MPVPRYVLPAGTELRLQSRSMTVISQDDHGYTVADALSGSTSVIPFHALVDQLRLPGSQLDAVAPTTGRRLESRLGGFVSASALPEMQQQFGLFHLAIAKALDVLREELRNRTGRPDAEVSVRYADANRERIRDIAEDFFGQKIHLTPPRGGRGVYWTLYRGRTLVKYAKAARGAGPGESCLDAVVPLDHLKGNNTARIPPRLRELMTQAWEEVGLDLKVPTIAAVRRHLEGLIKAENDGRARNGLRALITPSHATLTAHRNHILTPAEYSVATLGERETRRKRGRGSTDIRALLIGEYVEIDECKASLVVSAKERQVWDRLSREDQAALHDIDKEIRERLHILVMIDVACRMPLAWIVSDQPRAEATRALLRMATRDKSREKVLHGCENDPMPAVGIGHVKSDNGPGLRNAAAISSVLATGGMMTNVRAYAPTDKPYVERMFGTLEAVLLLLIHGYTGRKPGDLPGYDAVANGVLNLDLLQEILTRFMIDEYPLMRHVGMDMGMRRPIEVFRKINETRGCIAPIEPNQRRIALGWEQKVTASDEGVRVFSGIFFNSDRLQFLRDKHRTSGKVSVFVDPDDLNSATVLLPKVKELVEVQIQTSAFADLTLPEVLDLIALYRKEDPATAEIYDDRLIRLRRDRHLQLRQIAKDKGLSRSYSTVDECISRSKALLAGARVVPAERLSGTTRPGSLFDTVGDDAFIIQISDEMLIDGMATNTPAAAMASHDPSPLESRVLFNGPYDDGRASITSPTKTPRSAIAPGPSPSATFGRPKKLKELE